VRRADDAGADPRGRRALPWLREEADPIRLGFALQLSAIRNPKPRGAPEVN
jgi:hypothetical protein